MSEQIKVTDFQGVDHGIDNPSYFQGCGTAYTSYAYVQTGTADNPREALEDCLEMIAQGEHNIDTEDLKRRILDEYNNGKEFPELPSASADMLKANGYGDEFSSDELDEAEPERENYATDEEYDTAFSEWEDAYSDAQDKWEDEKENFFDDCESNYYHYSIRYNI